MNRARESQGASANQNSLTSLPFENLRICASVNSSSLSSTGLGVRLGPAPDDEFSVVQEVSRPCDVHFFFFELANIQDTPCARLLGESGVHVGQGQPLCKWVSSSTLSRVSEPRPPKRPPTRRLLLPRTGLAHGAGLKRGAFDFASDFRFSLAASC